MAVKKKGTGRRGGGTFSQFSNVNEASARSALAKGYRGGEKVASGYLKGGKGEIGGIKNVQNRYGTASDTIKSGYGTGRGDITASTGKQTGAINTGLDSSTGAVRSGAAGARYDIGDALNKSYGATKSGYGTARYDIGNALNQSYAAVTDRERQALAEYDPYARAGAAASDLYSGALGTDPTGRAAARSAFQTSPGYEFQMEQGLNQLERRAAARGQLGSGNTSLDSLTFSQGLADQDWSGWLDRLAAEQAMGVDVAGARSGIETGTGKTLADLYTGAGSSLSGLDTGEAAALSGLYTGAGSALSGIDTGEGTSLSNLYTGAGTELANIYGSEGTNLANLSTGEAGKLSDLTTGLAGQESDYAKTMADLAYRTKMGLGQTQAGYLGGRDQTGANIVGGATGAVNTGINLFNPAKKSTTSMAAG